MSTEIKFVKVRDVKTPTRGTSQSAGLDFYIPNDCNTILIPPGEGKCIPSGIHVKLPDSKVLAFFNKSGVAVKKGLMVGACIVDEDYQGEVHIHLINTSTNRNVRVEPGEKVIQGLILDAHYLDVKEVPSLPELYIDITERGQGGFGSTGNGLESETDKL